PPTYHPLLESHVTSRNVIDQLPILVEARPEVPEAWNRAACRVRMERAEDPFPLLRHPTSYARYETSVECIGVRPSASVLERPQAQTTCCIDQHDPAYLTCPLLLGTRGLLV